MTLTYPIVSTRVMLRPLEEADLDVFVGYRQNPVVARFQSWDTSFSRTDGLQLISAQADIIVPSPGGWLQLGIVNRATNELLGDVALHTRETSQLTFEIGFTLDPHHQGHGYAREAAGALTRALFIDAGAREVVATCDSRNERSVSVLLSLGFCKTPAKGWTELFKGETVVVDYYVLTAQEFHPEPT